MTFLAGGFLAGLGLIGLPVLIHLIVRRKRKLIPWGAMQFLVGTRSEEHTSALQSHRDLHSFPTRRSSDLLAGLGLIGLPVLIHLIVRRKRKLIPWGAMQFLVGT